ncbi:Aldehyde ferredoxin oxidoreductase [Solidesulfovibrio carbinoliphilus subsp. oakridgensis]|uniref:Aldehyde ferredoxin oxidoreductase n=1 Tax=Solidesulfovibrio carbinoliphilus subsp. oakridgensis TaxID=694327 RepID=G7Q9Z5_9BACT|nr:aldehyde ferredoxin oxidoreductase C-terminal domain-containing protein [Solidesulfovibrio carbinoliphilus]EHJ47825.1 Aldehyde ferredoxin oxidoreductase [Solidesulfovibrio carbinoliphilus subsp. oakridgensis]
MQHPSRPAILRVALHPGPGLGSVRRLPAPEALLVSAWGGRGLAGALLEDSLDLPWDAPRAAVCFAPGRLAGCSLPGAGHLSAAFLSPRTGGAATASLGGRLGTALARAGLAAVVVTGRADRPVGLEVRDDAAGLVDARELAGRPTPALFDGLAAWDAAAVVGPAGWAGSPLATLVADRWHDAGGAGLGLALAAKNFAFLAATGTASPTVADPDGLEKARAAMERLIAAAPALAGACGFSRCGTAALVDLLAGRRMLPTDNFRRTVFPRSFAANAPRLEADFGAHGEACPGCPVGCRRVTAEGRLLPDVDGLAHFTALLGLSDPELAVAARNRCLDHGLHAPGAAATLACRAEITGQPLSPDRVLELLAAMGAMDGEGRELGRGAAGYAASEGRPEAAMQVKGMELPAFDPRGAYGLALSLAVAPSGPDPWQGGCLAHELLRKPVATDRFTFEGKARAVVLGENAVAAAASLGGCALLSLAVGLEEWALALAAATGRPVAAGDLAALGEGTVRAERGRNARRGMGAADDDLPARFFTEPGTGGDGFDVPPLSRADFLAARAKYYRLRGCDADGRPTGPEAA